MGKHLDISQSTIMASSLSWPGLINIIDADKAADEDGMMRLLIAPSFLSPNEDTKNGYKDDDDKTVLCMMIALIRLVLRPSLPPNPQGISRVCRWSTYLGVGINVSNWVNKEIVQLIMLTRGEQRCSAADMIVVETSGSCMIRILSRGVYHIWSSDNWETVWHSKIRDTNKRWNTLLWSDQWERVSHHHN